MKSPTQNHCSGILRPWSRPLIMAPGRRSLEDAALGWFAGVRRKQTRPPPCQAPGGHRQAVPALTEPLGLPQPCPGPHFSPPLPRACLHLPTALPCPAPGPAQPGPPESAMRPARVFGRGEGCSGLLLSPCRSPQIGTAQPPSEDVDLHRLCSFYSSHPQQQDLGRKHCQESVTRDLIRQTAFNLISSTTSAFFFL